MTVISLKRENLQQDGAVTVEFSDGSSLSFLIDYLPETVLVDQGENSVLFQAGHELSAGEEEAFRFAAACYRAEVSALRLIARAEQSSWALIAKLKQRRFSSGVAKTVVFRLLDRNLLDDGRYAEHWIRSRLVSRKAPSPQLLLAALGKRGIDRNSSRQALNNVLDSRTEYELLLRYLDDVRLPQGKGAFSLRAQLKYAGFSSQALDRYFESER